MKVPFNDLRRIHKPIEAKIIKKFVKVVKENNFVLNEEIKNFEKEYSLFSNSKFAVSCANGTDAIELILRALNITKGDEVILPTNTFIATALAVTRAGATPVFVDNNNYYLIDFKKIEEKINKNTKAIIAVNLYGQLADLKKINAIAKKYSLYLIEDSAQSHGASNSNFKSNSIGAAYSFYPGKNLGAWGDGGMITTNNKKLYEKVTLLRNWGSVKKYEHKVFGFNSRLQPLQGVVLSEKLKNLNQWNAERQEIAKTYIENLSELKNVVLPDVMKGNNHVWHVFAIRSKKRNDILNNKKIHGIEFGIHYPKPIHRQKAYKEHRQYNSNIELADLYCNQLLSLPIFPKMKKSEIDHVLITLKKYLK